MTATSIVCGACSSDVPPGRLSCSHCGELLLPAAGARPVDAAASIPVAKPERTASTDSPFHGPGSYVPPSNGAVANPAGPAAPARSWAGTSSASAAVVDRPSTGDGVGTRPLTVDPARVAEFVGWLSVAGGALASVGFLLPWSNLAVIGSSGIGYFDRWGLAGPFHAVVVLGLLAVLVLSVVRNPVPVWIRVGLAGLTLSALLVGLSWPYLFGPLGAAAGVLCVALGAVMLGIAGVVAIVADRGTGAAGRV